MDLVLISDTHEQHRKLTVPDGDVLIHAGDFTYRGDPAAIMDFNEWLGELPHKHKIVICGNHEMTCDPNLMGYCGFEKHITNAILLNDSGIEIDGIRFWGSPITPTFCKWAFMRSPGEEIKKHWDLIPDDTDVLITHGPPAAILDKAAPHMQGCGDGQLLVAVDRIKPILHVFGHIHGSGGQSFSDGQTHYMNVSAVDETYELRPLAGQVMFHIKGKARAAAPTEREP